MKKIIRPFLVSLFAIPTLLLASGIEGHIYDKSGEPLIGATIFVRQTGQGAVTNAEGFYALLLPSGEQKVIFQFLGYETISKTVTIPHDRRLTLDVTMEPQSYRLQELEISGSDKEMANAIMRKAIAKAEYHLLQVDEYTATVYIKGSGRLKKSPRMFQKQIEQEGIDSTMSFTSESISEIHYQRPNKYDEKVISIYEHGESNNTSPMRFVQGSFYNDNIGNNKVSPLSKRAFAYYRFTLEGYFLDRGFGVNKIKVTPRSRGESVFEGYIYILEDYWSIHSLELTTYSLGFTGTISQIYAPVTEGVWMPITQKFIFDGKFFGFAFEYIYNAVSSGYTVKLNPDIDASFSVVDNKDELTTTAPAAKTKKEASALEKLNAGEELTRKNLRKIMREYRKEERKAQKEPEVVYEKNFTVDSLARTKDSSYWVTVRPIPLTKYEVKGYATIDSLNQVQKEKEEEEKLTGKKAKKKDWGGLGDILIGSYHKIGNNSAFYTKGLGLGFNFNPVEGYTLRETFNFSHSRKGGNKQHIYITPRYAFARKEFFLKGGCNFDFKSKNNVENSFQLEGGNYIFQYKEDGAILEILNSIENLFSERNHISLFQKKYAKTTYQRISDKWSLNTSFEWANRKTLNNVTTQTYRNRDDRDYAPNIPVNREATLPLTLEQKAAIFSISFEGRPWLKYQIINKKKQVIAGSSPTIGILYKKGIKNILNSEVDYDFAEVWFKKTFNVRAGTQLWLNLNAGLFLNKRSLGFSDFKHFTGNRLSLTDIDPSKSFRLMDYYRYSTRDKFLAVNTQYQFRKFLLTQIPQVWQFGIKENIFFNSLNTVNANNYWEVGYGIDNIFRIFRIEIAASFQGNQYHDWGFLIGVSSIFDKSFDLEGEEKSINIRF